MKVRRHSEYYNFIGDTDTGMTFRWGKSFELDPNYAPWPELADISISNHCSKGCDFCYRDSRKNYNFMSLENYEFLLQELQHTEWGNVFQVALGGGEPLEHPNFLDIINITNSYNVVPNFTTNGEYLTIEIIRELKNKVGAIALSVIDIQDLNREIIIALHENEITCNVHYLLNRLNLKQAIDILRGKYNRYFDNVNAIIFLTYKPLGRGDKSRCLQLNSDFFYFISAVENNFCSARIGFDACFVPILMHFNKLNLQFIDPCECGFFSIYINDNLIVSPCSFVNNNEFSFNLKEFSMEYIWTVLFDKYRRSLKNKCLRICENKSACRGCCPYFNEITLCYSSEKAQELLYANRLD